MEMETFVMPAIACLCFALATGVKMAWPTADRVHDFIPLGCAVLGIVLACTFLGVSLDSLATGAVSGLAATGIWELGTHIFPKEAGQ